MKKIKKEVTLYNILFPIWFLLVFPVTWIVVLPANFVIDSIVLLISVKLLKLANLKEVYKRTIVKVWLLGFASDFAGAGILFIGSNSTSKWDEYLYSLSWNPFDNWYALMYSAFAVCVSGLLIYIGNYKLSFNGVEIEKRKKRILALTLAIFTAPYIFFYPSSLINGGSWDELDFMTNHIVKRDEFRLEVSINQSTSANLKNDPIIMYYHESQMKDAINEAKKISRENTANSGPDYSLIFHDRDYNEKRSIPIWIDGNNGYFQYKDDWYLLDQDKIEPFLKAMMDLQTAEGKRGFVIKPDPGIIQRSEKSMDEKDKDGKMASEYPVFEDSRYEYYCEDRQLFDSAVIVFEDGMSSDIYTVLESGLITPQELIDHGMPLIKESRGE